jgi:hypothetical protein
VAVIDLMSSINQGTLPPPGDDPTHSFQAIAFQFLTPSAINAANLGPLGICGPAGCDTVFLNVSSPGIHCDLSTLPPAAKVYLSAFVLNGGKLIISNSECDPLDYSWLPYPFLAQVNPGPPTGGTMTIVEENTLSSKNPSSPWFIDASEFTTADTIRDMSAMITCDPHWCIDIAGTVTPSGATAPLHAYARAPAGGDAGLIIYNGADLDATLNLPADLPDVATPQGNLVKLWLQELQQPFNPSCLPCSVPAVGVLLSPPTMTNPVGTTHTVVATVMNGLGAVQQGIPVAFHVLSGPNASSTGTCNPSNCATDAGGQVTFSYGSNGTVGTDQIEACTTNPACADNCSLMVTKTWLDCDDGNVCTDDYFDVHTGCVHTNNTASCDDGNACTQSDSCQAGTCIGASPVICTASDQCHVTGMCDPGTGTCSNPARADGTACNDGSACTASDTCISGVCVGGPPPPELCNGIDDNCDGTIDEGCVGKVTGGGEIAVPGDKANFGFVAQRKAIGDPVTGQLEYVNHARGLYVHSTSILTLTVLGNMATFTGECTKNGAPCTFNVTVEDNGEPGTNDTFTIAVSGEPIEGAAATIVHGNIQMHAPGSGLSPVIVLAPGQSPNALAGAGSGEFPTGTFFNGVPLTGLRFGTGVDIPGNGLADGTHETTLLGVSALGEPQTITVEVGVTSGYVTVSGNIYVSGVSSVDMGDGTSPLTGVPFSLVATTDAQGQGVLAMTLDTMSLPAATVDQGGITQPPCLAPSEVGVDLLFVDMQSLTWSASAASSSYDLYRGSIDGGTWTFDHACLAPGLTSPAATDSSIPSAGEGFYYLVSGKNACGEGGLGVASNGQPRPNPSPCP